MTDTPVARTAGRLWAERSTLLNNAPRKGKPSLDLTVNAAPTSIVRRPVESTRWSWPIRTILKAAAQSPE